MSLNSGGIGDPGGGFNILPLDATEFPPIRNIQNKRRRNNDDSISSKVMYDGNEPHGVRYVLIKPADPNQPISENPFRLSADIDRMAGKVLDVNRMRSGEVMVKAKSFNQAKKIMAFKELPKSGTKVIIEEYAKLNQSRGKIYRHDFRSLSDSEILEGLKDQRVTHVYRQTKKQEGSTDKFVDSGVYILTFDSTILPQYVYAGYTRTKVSMYVPNPLRCKQCLLYGHSQKNCKGVKICAKCSEVSHEGACVSEPKCVNCIRNNEPNYHHSVVSRDCPTYKKEFEIQKIRTAQGVSPRQARRILESQPKPLTQRFSEVAKEKRCGCTCTCEAKKATVNPPRSQGKTIASSVTPGPSKATSHLEPVILIKPCRITASAVNQALELTEKSAEVQTLPTDDQPASEDHIMVSDDDEFNGFTSQEVNQQSLAQELAQELMMKNHANAPPPPWNEECDF